LTVSSFSSTNGEGQEFTRVYYGSETVIDTVLHFLKKSNNIIYACVDQTRPSLTIDIVMLKKAFLDAKNRGVKMLYVTEITKDNLSYCKQLLAMVDELRHLDRIKGNFYISETGYLAPATYHEKGEPASQIIYSNVKELINHQRYVFDTFWDKAIAAELRIREIEEGIDLGNTEVIQSSQKIMDLLLNMVKSAKCEILLILPTINAFLRKERVGVIELLIQAVIERHVKVRIITPIDKTVEDIVQNVLSTIEKQQPQYKKGQDKRFEVQYSDIRYEQTAVTTVTIVVVDRKKSLAMEKKDDSILDFEKATGLSTYSDSEPTVMSYVSIFEGLSIQGELNEQLKAHSLMQKEFINMAAHELRTPAQAILGYSELAMESEELKETELNLLRPIHTNAERLTKLVENMLSITRIESKTLKLDKEKVNIIEILRNVINDIKTQISSPVKLQIVYLKREQPVYVEADKVRLYQVIANLLSNAIKFTKEGTISIIADVVKDSNNEIIISVMDTGEGIHSDMLPRLFTMFATTSNVGTGLGLYISKSIVEAHGGRMWAENNSDGKGSTFSFTLPLTGDQ
jgi:two-component system, OmpR family, sensor histidine kinase VicK